MKREVDVNNMNIDIKDIITLDDNCSYVVASKANYQNQTYYYLIDEKNNSNIKFCYEDLENNCLFENDDEELNQKLLPLFYKNTKASISNLG